jgi:hypothetical protein
VGSEPHTAELEYRLREAGLGERALPGEDVRTDGVDERAVEVEDQCVHGHPQ